jgi:hypothetical protein
MLAKRRPDGFDVFAEDELLFIVRRSVGHVGQE